MNTKIFNKLVTPRLIIRPVTINDAKDYFSAEQASVNELSPNWSWVKTDKSIDDIKKFIHEAMEFNNKDRPSEMYFSLLSKQNQYLGMLWFFDINWFVPNFEIAYWLDTRATGNSYMSEAVNALTRTCFNLYDAKRVQIKISSKNAKSKKLAEKLNFKLEAEMENYFINFATNEINNGLLFSCCNPETLPALDIDIQLQDKSDDIIIRDITHNDFSALEKHFGKNTIYKKPQNHWQFYFDEHKNHNRIVKVIEIHHQVVGFGTLKFKSDYKYFEDNNIPEINDILVAPKFRNQGLGKAIVESLENSARENNYFQIGLAVGLYADYGSAQRLYKKLNYVPDGLGITYENKTVVPGESYPVDDDLLLWLTKSL